LGWFTIDFVSVLPFFLITLDYGDPWGDSVVPSLTGEDSGKPSALRSVVLIRVMRLLRMLKLARLFKATRVFERTLLDFLLHRWEMTHSILKMFKLVVILVFFAHLQACLWGLVSMWTDPPNWISAFDEQFTSSERPGEVASPLDRYVAALYWSVMTLTSIGYGEMTPLNTPERVLCSLWIMVSGVIWTYVIGSVAAIAVTLNPNQILFENTMDQLNYFMRERQLPFSMRMTLRDFFEAARRVNQLNNDAELLDKMTPLLQGSVALAANKQWLDQVWFFRNLDATRQGIEFVAALAKRLVIRNFVAKERLPVGQLYVLRRGMCVKMWRFLGTRKVFGEDIILDTDELMDHAQAVALTYVEAYTLRRHALDEVALDYEVAYIAVHCAARRITMQRAMLKYLTQKMGKRGPCSFILKSMAYGAETVDEKLTVEQKVDRTEKTLESVHSMLALSKLLGSKHIEGDKSLKGVEDNTRDNEELAIAMPAGRRAMRGAAVSSYEALDEADAPSFKTSDGTPRAAGAAAPTLDAVREAVREEVRGEVRKEMGEMRDEVRELRSLVQRLLEAKS